MKKYFVLIVMFFCVLCTHVHAGLLDEGLTDLGNLANKLDIKIGEFYDSIDDELNEIVQVSLISYKKDFNGGKMTLASLDFGYTIDDFTELNSDSKVILIANFNIGVIANWIKKTKLDKIPVLPVDISLGFGIGYDLEEHDEVVGVSFVGLKFKF